MRCVVTTVKGEPCKLDAIDGTDRCRIHVRARGNRSAFTEELADNLVRLLRAGNYDATAARAAGISTTTFYDWLARGESDRPDDEPYRRLLARVIEARAQGEAVHVARIAAAAQEDWHASAWFLERAYPEKWGRVSMRLREPADEAPAPAEPAKHDPFSEVDELANRRRKHTRT